MMLTARQQQLLDQMRSDNRSAGPPFATTGHWQRVATELQRWFDLEGILTVEDQHFNSHYSCFPPSTSAYYVYACQLMYRIVKAKDTLGVLPRLSSGLPPASPRRMVINGQALSWDLLCSADSILNIASIHPEILTAPWTIAEIGAGWGRMAYTLKQINPQCTYLIFDIPETLIVSSDYLPRTLAARYHGYGEPRDWSNLNDGAIWFCGAQEMQNLPSKSVDCVISTASFQELPHDYVDRYFDLIDRTSRVFYTLQHRHVTNYLTESYGNYFPFKANWSNRLTVEAAWSEDYFEAVFDL